MQDVSLFPIYTDPLKSAFHIAMSAPGWHKEQSLMFMRVSRTGIPFERSAPREEASKLIKQETARIEAEEAAREAEEERQRVEAERAAEAVRLAEEERARKAQEAAEAKERSMAQIRGRGRGRGWGGVGTGTRGARGMFECVSWRLFSGLSRHCAGLDVRPLPLV